MELYSKSHYKAFHLHQYLYYILMSHDLSHSHSQLLGFQINSLSHIPLSVNSLH